MDSVVDAKIVDYLKLTWHYRPDQCGTILDHMQTLARVAGYDLDERFASASLAAGPEASIAAGIVGRALNKGGSAISDYAIRTQTEAWLHTLPSRSVKY